MAAIKNLANGQLPGSKGTLYTAPGEAVVLGIDLVNTDGASKTANIYFKASAGTSRRIVNKDLTLEAGYHYQRTGKVTMSAGDVIEGDANAATTVDYVIHGVEL